MKLADYKCFYIEDCCSEDLHNLLVLPENQYIKKGFLISETGDVTYDDSGILKNRYRDNSIFLSELDNPFKTLISTIENKLQEKGVKKPIIFNSYSKLNPQVTITEKYWHKDFNLVKNHLSITDPKRIWYTFFIISKEYADSRIIVSKDQSGPFNTIGFDLQLKSNMLIAHNDNLGHSYKIGQHNTLNKVYMRWYDAE